MLELVFSYKGEIKHLQLSADYIIDNEFGDESQIVNKLHVEIYDDFVLIYFEGDFEGLLIFNLIKNKYDYYVEASKVHVNKKDGQLTLHIAQFSDEQMTSNLGADLWQIEQYP